MRRVVCCVLFGFEVSCCVWCASLLCVFMSLRCMMRVCVVLLCGVRVVCVVLYVLMCCGWVCL